MSSTRTEMRQWLPRKLEEGWGVRGVHTGKGCRTGSPACRTLLGPGVQHLDQNVFGEAAGSLPALARVSSRSLGQLFALCLDVASLSLFALM